MYQLVALYENFGVGLMDGRPHNLMFIFVTLVFASC